MSQQAGILDVTFKAGADLDAKQYFLVKLSAAQTVVLAAAKTDTVIGILQNKPKTGEAAVVRIAGTSKVSCGTPVTAFGNFVTSDANGQIVPTTATPVSSVIGIALEGSAAVNDVIEILIDRTRFGEPT